MKLWKTCEALSDTHSEGMWLKHKDGNDKDKNSNNFGNLLVIIYNALCNRQRWVLETKLLIRKFHVIVITVAGQFAHSTAANIAYLRHIPSEPLQDIGFELIPAINGPIRNISEIITLTIVFSVCILSLTPFLFNPTPVHWV